VLSRPALIAVAAAVTIGTLTIAGVAAASPPHDPAAPVAPAAPSHDFYMYCQDVHRPDGYYCVKVDGPGPADFRPPATIIPAPTTRISPVPANVAPLRLVG
jgi:hypothetical protein